jgi:hypothetical protein
MAVVDAERERLELEVELAVAQAWDTAAMSRVKKLLPKSRYLRNLRGEAADVPEPTPEQRVAVEAAALDWMAHLNGGGGAGNGQP